MPRGTDRYDEARLQGRLWTPKVWRGDLKLVAWWDFSNENGGLTIATGLSNAVDLSGRGNTLTQATGTSQPAYSPTGWTGGAKGAITPDGGDTLIFTNGLLYNSTTGLSAAVIAYNNASGTRTIFSRPSGPGTGMLRFTGTTVELVRNFQAALLATATGSCPIGVRIVGCDFQSNSCVAWIDGVSTSNSTDPGFSTNIECFFIDNGANPFSGGPVGEALFGLSRWTVRDRTLVDGYLAWKWRQVSNLVASHPFKNRPPLIGD